MNLLKNLLWVAINQCPRLSLLTATNSFHTKTFCPTLVAIGPKLLLPGKIIWSSKDTFLLISSPGIFKSKYEFFYTYLCFPSLVWRVVGRGWEINSKLYSLLFSATFIKWKQNFSRSLRSFTITSQLPDYGKTCQNAKISKMYDSQFVFFLSSSFRKLAVKRDWKHDFPKKCEVWIFSRKKCFFFKKTSFFSKLEKMAKFR